MKWFERFLKKKDDTPKCCTCGNVEMRQTTLDEWDPNVFLHDKQRKLTEWGMTTERVGMKSEKRKYRGNI